ncbi:MAG: DNA-processing protein DprA [Nocardioidaceae bacterium]
MVVEDAERRARMQLSKIAEPGDVDACALVHEHGAHALFTRLASSRLDDTAAKVQGWAERLPTAGYDELRERADRADARYVCPGDDEWPSWVDDLASLEGGSGDRRAGPPFGLWVRGAGDLAALTRCSVAIVGARAATAYGEHVAGDLAVGCADRGWNVVSGGAYGIDAAAHRGAIAAGAATVSVLAGGVDRLYPAGNSHLLRRVTAEGVLVSEAAPGCAPSRSRFLVRNRLIAAVTRGTVVVEAALRSGSLNTARWAVDLGRHVMGVPGPVTSMASAGVHEFLRQSGAVLVTAADEVVEHLSPVGAGLAARRVGPVEPTDRLDPGWRRLLDAVPKVTAAPARSIALAAGLPYDEVLRMLASLADLALVDDLGADRWRLSARDDA